MKITRFFWNMGRYGDYLTQDEVCAFDWCQSDFFDNLYEWSVDLLVTGRLFNEEPFALSHQRLFISYAAFALLTKLCHCTLLTVGSFLCYSVTLLNQKFVAMTSKEIKLHLKSAKAAIQSKEYGTALEYCEVWNSIVSIECLIINLPPALVVSCGRWELFRWLMLHIVRCYGINIASISIDNSMWTDRLSVNHLSARIDAFTAAS